MRKLNNLEPKFLNTMKKRPISLLQDFCSHPNPSPLIMSKPIRFISPLLLLAFCIVLFACGKEEPSPTVIKGKVTDKKTGEPIEGAYIDCIGLKGENNNQISKDFSTYSDDFGDYEITIPQEYRISFPSVYEPNHLPKIDPGGATTIEVGNTNIINVELVPTDGFLRLTLKNEMVLHDSIYVKIFSPTAFSEGLGVTILKSYPIVLSSSTIHIENIAFPSEENIVIYWDYKHFIVPNSFFQNSIFLSQNDTIGFTISF